MTEFQSHQKHFDVLNSQEIPETVTAIEWLNNSKTDVPKVLASNARQIKLFKIKTRQVYEVESIQKRLKKGKSLTFPRRRVISE